jgi:hypothetical protein
MAMIPPGLRRKKSREEEEEEERERERARERASEREREPELTPQKEREKRERVREREGGGKREKDTARTPQYDAPITSTRAAYTTRKCAFSLPRAMPRAIGGHGIDCHELAYASTISNQTRRTSSEVKSSHRRHDGRLVELSAAAAGHVQRPAPKET